MRQPGALRSSSLLHFWLVPVSALRADPVPHAISLREGRQWQLAARFLTGFFFFNGAGESGSVTLLRPSQGKSGDIAVRHRIEPQRRGCVSTVRVVGTSCEN